ncbi:phospholipase B1, membrane-associated-like [Ctenocephalides felis]|uniref:phospholipase B1, membrane-associated-like n=1 Tax=Ctenocephalides felis TaxID=7515 RepID=UPI000E6E42AB|nr:phospholipase B1, membrane-associated-like [Ctenocephalides felis]
MCGVNVIRNLKCLIDDDRYDLYLLETSNQENMNAEQVVRENRGLSWAAGGQGTWREFTTFPNIIKVYNPALQGYAINDGFTVHNTSKLNLGEPGALSIDMLYSAQVLLRRMQDDPNIDVQKHWKVITIMIGANDMCSHVCYERNPESYPELHRRNLIKALKYIKNNIPRSFVNIVAVPPINLLTGFRHQPPICWAWHLVECSCFFGSRVEKQQPRYINILKRWVAVEKEVSALPEFQDKEDFAVVFQPFTTEIEIPKNSNGLEDLSYLSVDCFHLSQKSNALAGVALFNNMFQPIGQKDTNWKPYYDNFPCPSKANPYIKTHLNSNK